MFAYAGGNVFESNPLLFVSALLEDLEKRKIKERMDLEVRPVRLDEYRSETAWRDFWNRI